MVLMGVVRQREVSGAVTSTSVGYGKRRRCSVGISVKASHPTRMRCCTQRPDVCGMCERNMLVTNALALMIMKNMKHGTAPEKQLPHQHQEWQSLLGNDRKPYPSE